MVEILYQDADVLVCVKPPRVLSTDEPGGLPELLRQQLGDPKADIRTVHRLDRVVSGLMVLARNPAAASELSRQVRENEFKKLYHAVLHGVPEQGSATLCDLLGRDKARKMTYVAPESGKGIQEASLSYRVLSVSDGLSRVEIELHTGRTHQIRVQFASRGMPLVGERKYAVLDDPCNIALFSQTVGFYHPASGTWMEFSKEPPQEYPWKPATHYDFFQNRECEYFPCHPSGDLDTFSCIFCYCPLYALGDRCGGNFTYTEKGIKDCSSCLRPHRRENYPAICEKLKEVVELAKNK